MIQSTFFAGVLAAFLAAFLGGVISVIRLASERPNGAILRRK